MQSHQIDVALLTEVWWDNTFHPPPHFPGYTLYHNLRKISSARHRGGGSAILIKATIPSKHTPPKDTSETTWATIYPKHNQSITLSSAYIPPNSSHLLTSFLTSVTTTTSANSAYLLTGDFNAHHPSWSHTQQRPPNSHGNTLHSYLNQHDLFLVPLNSHTYTPHQHQQQSGTIDLAIASPSLSQNMQTTVTNLLNSDHHPIIHTIKTIPSPTKPFRPTWKLASTPPEKWSALTDNHFRYFLDRHKTKNLESFTRILTNTLKHLLQTHVGKTTPPPTRFYKPWWNPTLSSLSKARKRARRRWVKHRTPHLRKAYNKASKLFYAELQKAEANYKEEFAQRLTLNPNSHHNAWKYLKRLSKTTTNHNAPILDPQTRTLQTTDTARAKTFANHYKEVFTSQTTDNHRHTKTVRDYLRHHSSDFKPSNNPNQSYNTPFTLQELQHALKSLRNTSPGPDDIPNWCLKHAGSSLQQTLLHAYNLSWKTGKLPTPWKHSHIISIPKPQKNTHLPNNYRPISLLSALSKLQERLVYNRLQHLLETRKHLHPHQFAYRKNHSTEQLLLTITSDIQAALNRNMTPVLLTLDIQKAFDSVWTEGLTYKLHRQLKISGNLLSWLTDFLQNRTFSTRVNNYISSTNTTQRGIPQGSVLSAILFSIYINDLPHVSHSPTYLYADDTTILDTHKSLSICTKRLQQTLKAVTTWARTWKVTFNPTKCSYTIFSKRRQPPSLPEPLTLTDFTLSSTTNPRILGVTFDTKLSFKTHLQKVSIQATRKLQLLRKISGNKHASRNILLTVYKTLILPTLEYASTTWHNSKHTKQLDILHRSALRTILRVKASTPTHILHAETQLQTLKHRRKQHILKVIVQTSHLYPLHPLKLLLQNQLTKTQTNPSPVLTATNSYKNLTGYNLDPNPPQNTILPQHASTPPWQLAQTPPKTNPYIKTSLQTLNKLLLQILENKYQNQNTGQHYHQLRPTLSDKFPTTTLENHLQTSALLQLRIGHNHLPAHNKFSTSNSCRTCKTAHNLDHHLFTCKTYHRHRQQFLQYLNNFPQLTKPYSAKQLLSISTKIPPNAQKKTLIYLTTLYNLYDNNL